MGPCLAKIDREKAYQILSDDIAPSLAKVKWDQKYQDLESLKKFIDDRDLESYCATKFRVFDKDYARQEYCEAVMNVRPKPQDYCTEFKHQQDNRTFHYPLVYKYSCFIKNGIAFGDNGNRFGDDGERIDAYHQAHGCRYTVDGDGKHVITNVYGGLATDGTFAGNYRNCADFSIFPALMDCFFELNMFRAQECFERNEIRLNRSLKARN